MDNYHEVTFNAVDKSIPLCNLFAKVFRLCKTHKGNATHPSLFDGSVQKLDYVHTLHSTGFESFGPSQQNSLVKDKQ